MPSTSYQVEVAAVNSFGTGPYSERIEGSTLQLGKKDGRGGGSRDHPHPLSLLKENLFSTMHVVC